METRYKIGERLITPQEAFDIGKRHSTTGIMFYPLVDEAPRGYSANYAAGYLAGLPFSEALKAKADGNRAQAEALARFR